MTPRFGVVGLWHETNTYSASVTTLDDFERFELATGARLAELNVDTGTVIGGFLSDRDADLVPLFSAGAWPSGPTEQAVLDELVGRMVDEVRRAPGLDGMLVNLHGAMVATGSDDVEVEVVRALRAVVGDLPLGVVLDLHANPSPELVRSADVLVSYDTFPHVDMFDRGREVAGLLRRVASGEALRTSLRKIPLLVSPIAQSTDAGPLAEVQALASARAARAGIDRVCVVGGFAFSDVARAGTSVMAIHRPEDSDAATDVLDGVVHDIAERASQFTVARPDAETAVAAALVAHAHPVFLVDVADNIGGGSPGDGTTLLAELLRRDADGADITDADAQVAHEAARLGEDETIGAWLGGKTDGHHGEPVFIEGVIVRVTDGRYRSAGYYMAGQTFTMGVTAVIRVRRLTVVVTEFPTPPFHSEQLSSVGIDVSRASIVVMKGALAWRGAYPGVPAEIIEAATPGITPVDVSTLPRATTPMTL